MHLWLLLTRPGVVLGNFDFEGPFLLLSPILVQVSQPGAYRGRQVCVGGVGGVVALPSSYNQTK